jgi:hypothetical protein
MGEKKNAYCVCGVEGKWNLKKRDHCENIGVDGWIILKWILRY